MTVVGPLSAFFNLEQYSCHARLPARERRKSSLDNQPKVAFQGRYSIVHCLLWSILKITQKLLLFFVVSLKDFDTILLHMCISFEVLRANAWQICRCVIKIALLYSWRFSRYSAPIHWLVHGHMTSNNETVSRQMP